MPERKVLHAGQVNVGDETVEYKIFYPDKGGEKVDHTEAIQGIEDYMQELLDEDVSDSRVNYYEVPPVQDVFEFDYNDVHLEGKWWIKDQPPATKPKNICTDTHEGNVRVLGHDIHYKCYQPENAGTPPLDEIASCVKHEAEESLEQNIKWGNFGYEHQGVTFQTEWSVQEEEKPKSTQQDDEYDEFQRAVEAVLIDFVERADKVLEKQDVAECMVIPIKDVKRFRDAIDTARDVLFS